MQTTGIRIALRRDQAYYWNRRVSDRPVAINLIWSTEGFLGLFRGYLVAVMSQH